MSYNSDRKNLKKLILENHISIKVPNQRAITSANRDKVKKKIVEVVKEHGESIE